MKKKIMILSTVLLISILVAGSTFAWFYAGDNSIKSNKMSIIQVETVREDGSAKVKHRYWKRFRKSKIGTTVE